MTVKELIEVLKEFDGNNEIVVCCDNDYAYDIGKVSKNLHHIRTYFGDDHNALIVSCGSQCGMDWGVEE